MPTKNSRLVCDGDSVDVVIAIDDTEAFTGNPFVSWDRHWKFGSGPSPAVGTDGMVFEDGLVEWGTITPMVAEFSVTLEYDHCWADNEVQYGEIEAGDRDGDFTLIDGANCVSDMCCEPEYVCDDCCFYVGPDDNTAISYELDDAGNPVFWSTNGIGDKIKVTVEGTDNGLICIPGAQITLTIKLIPTEFTGDPWLPEMSVVADGGWKFLSATPSIGTGTIVPGPVPAMSVTWGVEVDAIEYSLITEVPCPHTPDALNVGFDKNSQGGGEGTGAGVRIEFTCCSEDATEFSCDDCYPPPYKLCCTIQATNYGETPLQDIRDFINAGGFELNANWHLAFAKMGYDADSDNNANVILHFVACSVDPFESGDDCAGQVAAFCAALAIFSPTSGCIELTPPTECFSDFAFEAWVDGELCATGAYTNCGLEAIVDEMDQYECDDCPPEVP